MLNISGQKNNQSGAVLITALVMLVILTLLGLATMGTSSMEEKMAANSQEINRAFQAAETGLEIAMTDKDAFTMTTSYDDSKRIGSYGASTTYRAEFKQKAPPPRNSGWDAKFNSFYYFDLSAEGSTPSGASARVHGGAYQVGPGGN